MNATCKGSYSLGTACEKCAKCSAKIEAEGKGLYLAMTCNGGVHLTRYPEWSELPDITKHEWISKGRQHLRSQRERRQLDYTQAYISASTGRLWHDDEEKPTLDSPPTEVEQSLQNSVENVQALVGAPPKLKLRYLTDRKLRLERLRSTGCFDNLWNGKPFKIVDRPYPPDGGLQEPVREFGEGFNPWDMLVEHFSKPSEQAEASRMDEDTSAAPSWDEGTRGPQMSSVSGRTIYKYQMPVKEEFELVLPVGAQIIRVDSIDGIFWMWAVIDNRKSDFKKRSFRAFKTGAAIPTDNELNYIGFCTLHIQQQLGLYIFEDLGPKIRIHFRP